MNRPGKLALIGICIFVSAAIAQGKPKPVSASGHKSAPPSLKISRDSDFIIAAAALAPEDQYSIGDPTEEEQEFVELINRARANANAEALRLANTDDPDVLGAISTFGVNLTEMINQFSDLDPILPPLSIHAELTAMARLHSQDMFDNVFQGHISSSTPPAPYSAGDTLPMRAAEFSYPYSALAENVFAFGRSVFYSHAGFEIDWGFGPNGMQDPPGHRITIHNSAYREIGVGVILGTNSIEDATVGPVIVTQNFGAKLSPVPFITGVTYYDLNINERYDAGEGIGGFTVETSEEDAWAETVGSGGYSIPVTTNGIYNVTISGPGLTPQMTPVTIASGNNTKHDLALAYAPPVMTGDTTPITSSNNTYAMSIVPGATSYRVRVLTSDATAWLEGAEDGTTNITIDQSAGYDVIQSTVVKTGTNAFHLAHPTGGPDETITINYSILPSSTSEIQFASRLGLATPDQSANVEVSTDDGFTWINLYSQAGTNGFGETAWINRTISLAAYDNIPLRIRFRYAFSEGFIYNGIDTSTGWLIDDITVSNATRLTTESETIVGAPLFTFNPSTDGQYYLMARLLNNSKEFPFGPILEVNAGPATAFDLWRIANFSLADLNDPAKEATVWGDDADPENDGLRNLLEYALLGDPNAVDAVAILPQLNRSGSTLTLSYTMQKTDVTYRVLTNTILQGGGWTTTDVTQTPDPDIAAEGTPIDATVTLGEAKRFLQLEVTLP